MREGRLKRFWLPLFAALAIGAGLAACADAPSTADEGSNTDEDTTGGADGAIADGAGGQDATAGTDGGAQTGSDTNAAGDTATTADTTAAGSDAAVADGGAATGDAGSAQADGAGTDAGGPPDIGPVKKLPLPDCAYNCNDCAKCPDTPMCVDGKTYLNDCQAICDLQAFDWPQGIASLTQGACPECKSCNPNDKPGTDPKFCAKTKGGAWVPVMLECELDCLELWKKVPCTNNKCEGSGVACNTDYECSKESVLAGGCQKQNECMQAPASCPVKKFMPVCASDGMSYQHECAMTNCDKKGCFPLGEDAKSSGCTASKLTKLCEGECFDAEKWKACASDSGCAPVCGLHKDGKGVSYRNKCVASLEGAKVASCDGISATPADKCSAELYAEANDGKGRGCCDIDYSIVKPVCASRTGADSKAVWYSFRSNSEFECLTGADKANWTFQYQGPCICQCPDVSKPVCGADGQTYQNACQAECYGGANFKWENGECKG